MIRDRSESLKPLIDSSNGIHLTCYLLNRGDTLRLKQQLRDSVAEAIAFLQPVMTSDEQREFLEPLQNLVEDISILKDMKNNIGIFRNENSFRILSIPVDLEPLCVVATTFHIKPLLKWIQSDREFLILGLENNVAHLYQGSQQSLTRIDSILYPRSLEVERGWESYSILTRQSSRKRMLRDTMIWINDWIYDLAPSRAPKLFVAGTNDLTDLFYESLRYPNAASQVVWPSFHEGRIFEIASEVRRHINKEVSQKLERTFQEFQEAEEFRIAKESIFQIARAASDGRVRKLIIAEDAHIFGKLNRKSGELSIHPCDLDHEDDDLLDDLAQTVLARGGGGGYRSTEENSDGSASFSDRGKSPPNQ